LERRVGNGKDCLRVQCTERYLCWRFRVRDTGKYPSVRSERSLQLAEGSLDDIRAARGFSREYRKAKEENHFAEQFPLLLVVVVVVAVVVISRDEQLRS
jgi:hypothetical protein